MCMLWLKFLRHFPQNLVHKFVRHGSSHMSGFALAIIWQSETSLSVQRAALQTVKYITMINPENRCKLTNIDYLESFFLFIYLQISSNINKLFHSDVIDWMLDQASWHINNLSPFCPSYLVHSVHTLYLSYLIPKTFTLFGFTIFWPTLMYIPQTRRAS